MIGLIVFTVGGLLLAAYGWLVFVTYRFVRRRTGSDAWAALSLVGILILTVGDTVFNRWYLTNVLCKREDVGVKVFETVKLSNDNWDNTNDQPALPTDMRVGKPFLGRYVEVRSQERGGLWPFTYYTRLQFLVVDIKTAKVLSRFVNYLPSGGMWWTIPLALVGSNPSFAWFLSRGDSKSCFKYQSDGVVEALRGAFVKSTEGAMP